VQFREADVETWVARDVIESGGKVGELAGVEQRGCPGDHRGPDYGEQHCQRREARFRPVEREERDALVVEYRLKLALSGFADLHRRGERP